MSDIVERLRARDAYLSLDEADDEIERLRGLLARIDNCDAITIDRDFPQAKVDEAEAIWDDIHAALAGAAVQPSAASARFQFWR